MTIVFLTPGFPSDESDTSCLPYLQDFILSYRQQFPSDSIHVLSLRYPFGAGDYSWHGIPVYAAAGGHGSIRKRLLCWFRIARRFVRIRRCGRIDVIHSFWIGETTVIGECMRRLFGYRHIVSVMGRDAVRIHRLAAALLSRLIVAVPSTFAALAFERTYRQPVHAVIPVGLIPFRHAHSKDRSTDILAVGSLVPIKNHAEVLRVVAELRRWFPNLQCTLIGDGPQRETLLQLRASLHLEDAIDFIGLIPREEVLHRMMAAKILLHTSTFETQGYVMLEALASGMHVVTSPVGYVPPSPQTHICCDRLAMVRCIADLLTNGTTFNPVSVPNAVETAEAYKLLYEKSPAV